MKLCLVCNLNFTDEYEVCPKDNAKLILLSEDPLVGLTIQDRYKIQSIVGKGSMGVVYKANQELIGRQVAVKVLHRHLVTDNESLKRFQQQAKAASRLNHPHIITLYDYGIIPGGQPYIVMDLLGGRTLANLIEERGFLPVEECLPIFKQICEALGDAHKHGVIHRDVKPENIILEEANGQTNWVKIVDFGIAKIIQRNGESMPRITRTGTVCGSPAYMSPEQYSGSDVDQKSDIYSLGAVLFETLTGHLPFTALDLIGLMTQHISQPPPKLNQFRPEIEFPPQLEKMVHRALAKEPDCRPATMEDFYDELKTASRETRPSPLHSSAENIPAFASRTSTSGQTAAASSGFSPTSQSQPVTPAPTPQTSAPVSSPKSVRSRPVIPIGILLLGFGQTVFPYALTMALLTVFMMILSNDTQVGALFKQQVDPLMSALGFASGDPQALYNQGRLDEATTVLEQRRQIHGLKSRDTDLLYRIYLQLAKHAASQKAYSQAIDLLRKVPRGCAQWAHSASLIRKYQHLQALQSAHLSQNR